MITVIKKLKCICVENILENFRDSRDLKVEKIDKLLQKVLKQLTLKDQKNRKAEEELGNYKSRHKIS